MNVEATSTNWQSYNGKAIIIPLVIVKESLNINGAKFLVIAFVSGKNTTFVFTQLLVT